MAEQKGVALRCEIVEGTPATLYTDWTKVEQVIRNFLSNAFKFTVQGHVVVRIARPHADTVFLNPGLSRSNCVGISVIDSGIGIPDDKREQIFEAFRQVDGTTSRKYGGSGLGLSISRKFAELLGGEIQVHSRVGHGSTFTLLLPIRQPEDPAHPLQIDRPAAENSPETSSFQDTTRILLIVDDDSRNLFAMNQLLQNRVGTILTARNGREAIEVLEIHPEIDLVLMDI
ncbi:MAG: hybrid sensor histidine kinase/response regulator, partial [Magnetococcales bacterium]|nr:hybrid sensor histidine kinase/response regulator [Magnetococcales bacterium]